jgi:hypothetical protein
MCRGRRARILLHLHIQLEGTVLRGSRAGRRFGCRNHPSSLRACVREEDAGGREAGAHSTTPTYTVRRDGPARELVGVLVAETIHPACMCEGGGRGGERGGHAFYYTYIYS